MYNVVTRKLKYVVEPNYFGPKKKTHSVGAHWKFTLHTQVESRLFTIDFRRDWVYPILIAGVFSGHRSFANCRAFLEPSNPRKDSVEHRLQQLISMRSERAYHQIATVSKYRVLLGVKGWKRFEHSM